MLDCIVVPVVAAVGVPRCLGVYGTYFMGELVSADVPETEDTEDADEVGPVGESSGCAVSDSCELVRGIPLPDRPMEPGGNRLSRRVGSILLGRPQPDDYLRLTMLS